MRPIPYSTLDLIEELEVQFPPKCKLPEESLEAHARYAGAAALVRLLRDRFEANLKKDKTELPKVLQGI